MNNNRNKTLYDGQTISSLGIGTWRMGGEMSANYKHDTEHVEAIRYGIQLGFTHIDTAEVYGKGHTEELVSQAITRFNRKDLFITTKVWYTNMRYPAVLKAIEGSLKRLSTDYVDLYLIHWPNPSIQIEETMRGLNEAVQRGLTRYIGVSNFDLDELKQASALADHPLATNQVPYSLGQRKYVHNGMLHYCQEHNIILTAYSPLDLGNTANKTQIKKIAEKHEATPFQVALAWLIRQPNVIAIPKAANPRHLEDNIKAVELELSQEDIEILDRID